MPLPTFTLQLDQPRQLRYTWNALARLEQALAKPLRQIISEFRYGDVSMLRTLVWAGLLHAQPDLTLNDVGPMLDAYVEANGGDLFALYQAWDEALSTSGMLGKVEDPKGGAEGNGSTPGGGSSS